LLPVYVRQELRREDHRRSGGAAGVLRLPGRALDPLADHESAGCRVDDFHRKAADRGHPRRRSPAAALAMVFKLVESAQARRCAIIGAHLVPWAASAPGSRGRGSRPRSSRDHWIRSKRPRETFILGCWFVNF